MLLIIQVFLEAARVAFLAHFNQILEMRWKLRRTFVVAGSFTKTRFIISSQKPKFIPHWCSLNPLEMLYLRHTTPKLYNHQWGDSLSLPTRFQAVSVSKPKAAAPWVPKQSSIPTLLNFRVLIGAGVFSTAWSKERSAAKTMIQSKKVCWRQNRRRLMNGMTSSSTFSVWQLFFQTCYWSPLVGLKWYL